MMYTRAAASDYDDWESKHDNPGLMGVSQVHTIIKEGKENRTCCYLSIYDMLFSRQRHSSPEEILKFTEIPDQSKYHIPRIDIISGHTSSMRLRNTIRLVRKQTMQATFIAAMRMG